eukprot:631743-Hanusia_phi.AAC.1
MISGIGGEAGPTASSGNDPGSPIPGKAPAMTVGHDSRRGARPRAGRRTVSVTRRGIIMPHDARRGQGTALGPAAESRFKLPTVQNACQKALAVSTEPPRGRAAPT